MNNSPRTHWRVDGEADARRRRQGAARKRTLLFVAAVFVLGFTGTLAALNRHHPMVKEPVERFARLVGGVSPYARYPRCAVAHREGVYSIPRGDPAYRPELDADHDGFACEPFG